MTQLYDQALAPSGLKVTQYSLIAHARRKPGEMPPTLSELALKLHTDRTTLTRNLKPLVDANFINVIPGADARSKVVMVTPDGEAALLAARPYWKVAQLRLRELAGNQRIDVLHALVDAILPHLDAPEAEGE